MATDSVSGESESNWDKMPALMERPKMSLAMWAALKSHIMKQREKKKQEQEADAAVERLRREQEMKRKQDAMTLEEIREQLIQLEKKLKDLKNEKHELFLYLKRVLNEDEKRRNEEDKEANEMMHANHPYPPPPGLALGPSNMYMIAGNTFMNRNQVLYKVGTVPQQNGTIKRSRSPSPPPPGFQQGFGYKTHVTTYGQKPTSYANAVGNSGYYTHSTASASGTSSTLVVTNSTPPYAAYPIPHPAGPFPTQEQAKHLPPGYHVPHLQQPGFVGTLHQPVPHADQKPNVQEEKYYVQPGGISSGYPVRGQPPQSRFQPPTSQNASSPIQVSARKEDLLRRSMPNENQR